MPLSQPLGWEIHIFYISKKVVRLESVDFADAGRLSVDAYPEEW
jgi:hypothetical protein